MLSKALRDIYFSADKSFSNVVLLKPSNEMMNIPLITSGFANHNFVWGDNPLMRWACQNSKTVTSPAGNITYGKIEPKSRKNRSVQKLLLRLNVYRNALILMLKKVKVRLIWILLFLIK